MENRACQDRRKKPTPILSRYTLTGRRSAFRRKDDRLKPGYVDRYSERLLISIVLIVGLNILDTLFTILILASGGLELNPIVRWAIDSYGDVTWAIKFALVACGSLILCLHCHFRMAQVSIMVIAILFSGVVMYQLMVLRYIYM